MRSAVINLCVAGRTAAALVRVRAVFFHSILIWRGAREIVNAIMALLRAQVAHYQIDDDRRHVMAIKSFCCCAFCMSTSGERAPRSLLV